MSMTKSTDYTLGNLTWYERFGCNVLKQGSIPHHIAFIMDGNRRYARVHNTAHGYESGYNTFIHLLDLCYTLGISYITVYAFSTDNFNRDSEEINTIMELAYIKFMELSNNTTLLNQYSIRINFIGNRYHPQLPTKLKLAIEQCEYKTKQNTGTVLNICFVYSSTDEIHTKLQHIQSLIPTDTTVDELPSTDILKHCTMHNTQIPVVDLLVRTSGETRFSDFLLYYINECTHICFIQPYWPQLNMWHFCKIILEYQYYKKSVK